MIRAAPVGDELPWRDTTLPPEQRVTDLLSRMTLQEKVAQLYGVWVGMDESGEQVAPHQHDLARHLRGGFRCAGPAASRGPGRAAGGGAGDRHPGGAGAAQRPALRARGFADRLAGIVQAYFPGEEGGAAVAGVLSGRVNPSGRLPVGVPRDPGGQPGTYLAPPLGRRSQVSNLDPTPLFPFGHGCSYTRFAWEDVTVDGRPLRDGAPTETATDGSVQVALTVTNTGERAGADVVQLYLHDPVAQVTRPVVRLVGYARVELRPGQARRVTFTVPADLSSFSGLAGHRIVEPGDLELRISTSSGDARHVVPLRLVGPERRVDHRRALTAAVTVD